MEEDESGEGCGVLHLSQTGTPEGYFGCLTALVSILVHEKQPPSLISLINDTSLNLRLQRCLFNLYWLPLPRHKTQFSDEYIGV